MLDPQHLHGYVRSVELGSIERAAAALQWPSATVRDGLTALERQLGRRLLEGTDDAVLPTAAGFALFREARAALRHLEQAERATGDARLQGAVSVGLTPTACAVLGLPLVLAMRERYPDVRLRIVESLSGHLAAMLAGRQLDLALLYGVDPKQRWHVSPLVEEQLFLVQSRRRPLVGCTAAKASLETLAGLPLILPSGTHGLRQLVDAVLHRARVRPCIVTEIDSLAILMQAVEAGLGATVQPWAATRCDPTSGERFVATELGERDAARSGWLSSLADDELSPAALATRVLLARCARELVRTGVWSGTRIAFADTA